MERETYPFDVLFVGGGPAGLAGALRLAQLAAEAGRPVALGVKRGTEENEPVEVALASAAAVEALGILPATVLIAEVSVPSAAESRPSNQLTRASASVVEPM